MCSGDGGGGLGAGAFETNDRAMDGGASGEDGEEQGWQNQSTK